MDQYTLLQAWAFPAGQVALALPDVPWMYWTSLPVPGGDCAVSTLVVELGADPLTAAHATNLTQQADFATRVFVPYLSLP